MAEVRSVYDILVVGSEGKRLFWIQTNKEGNRESGRSLKKEQDSKGANWIQLIHELDQSLVLVKTAAQIMAIFI
jgi:hypothetical protein